MFILESEFKQLQVLDRRIHIWSSFQIISVSILVSTCLTLFGWGAFFGLSSKYIWITYSLFFTGSLLSTIFCTFHYQRYQLERANLCKQIETRDQRILFQRRPAKKLNPVVKDNFKYQV